VGSDDGFLYAVDLSGNVLWAYHNGGSPFRSSPAIPCDIYALLGADDGYIYAVGIYPPMAGSLCWSYPTGGMVRSSPAVGNAPPGNFYSILYVGSDDGDIYAIGFSSACSAGSFWLEWTFSTGGPVRSSPALLDLDGDGRFETVVVGSDDGNIYAINSFSNPGTLRWMFPTGGRVRSSPAVDSLNNVYVGSDDGYLYALNGATGALIWSYYIGEPIRSSPSISPDSTIYVGADDGYIYAINQCVNGDANGDGIWDLGDVIYLINYLYRGGPPPVSLQAGDAHCDGIVDLADVVYLINYLYRGGSAPCPC